MQYNELRQNVKKLRDEMVFEYEDKLRRTKFLTLEEELIYNALKGFCDQVISWLNTPNAATKARAVERKKHNERYYKRPADRGTGSN